MRFLLALTAALGCASQALAAPVTDCPNRDAPFSADSPMIDLLLSPAASAIIAKAMPPRAAGSLPPSLSGTTTPSFMALLTLKEASRFTGMKPEDIGPIDAELRTLPVTAADRIARCARYDNDVPQISLPRGKLRVLVFEKITGFKDAPSFNAAHEALFAMAARKGWAIAATASAGVFNAKSLRQFDVVIWNNISGDVLTLAQRAAFKRYMEHGGGFVGVHGSLGDPVYFWDWYADTLLGARFLAHPMDPQFQDARVVTSTAHPLARGLPTDWVMKDEWYSFRSNPKLAGAQVVLSLDEGTYKPERPMGVNLRMGDHPIAWTMCVGPTGRERGRAFYSAIGHLPETYSHPNYVTLLENAIVWAGTKRGACRG